MFLTYISKNFDDGPYPFGYLLFGHICGQCFVSKIAYQFWSFSASFAPFFLKRVAKIMENISSPNFIEI